MVREARLHAYPTADIDEMLAEIERGYVVEAALIFVDSNVPMYLVGAPHPHKVDARASRAGHRPAESAW